MDVLLSAGTIRNALEGSIEALFQVPKEDILGLSKRPLVTLAKDIRSAITSDIISVHLLKDIVKFSLDDVVLHAEAIDRLEDNKATLLHVRHIEEIYTVIKFIVGSPERYSEFHWRWNSFKFSHAIRNRIININNPLEKEMQDWIDSNIENLKKYISKKFESDPNLSLGLWEKYNNWLYPINLKDIFSSAGRRGSYVSAEYDWNSQAVHFSPLADQYFGYNIEHFTYGEFSKDCVVRYMNLFCVECLALVRNREALRKVHAKNVFIDTYRLINENPKWYIEISNKGGRYAHLTEFVLRGEWDISKAMDIVIGKEPKDPLAFSFI